MSNNKMLIDAAHPEETRVAIVRGNRVDEFDFESEHKSQLRGNIYLAKVTRVEPSLQAAFVDYGGNRHGFLAFSEIHPDYYQIPIADRQALLDAEAEDARAAAAQEAAEDDSDSDQVEGDTKAQLETQPTRKRRSRRKGVKKTDSAVSDNDAAAETENNNNQDKHRLDTDRDTGLDTGNDTVISSEDDEESDGDASTMAAENDGDDVVSESAAAADVKKTAKKPRRRTSRKKVETADDTATTADAPETIAAEEKKPPRRRTSRKKVEASKEVVVTATTETPAAIPGEEKKPARRRTSRKKATEPETKPATTKTADETPEAASPKTIDATADNGETKKPRKRTTRAKKPKVDPVAQDSSGAGDIVAGSATTELQANTDSANAIPSGGGSEDGEPREQRKPRSRNRSRRRQKSDEPASDNREIPVDGSPVVEDLGVDDALEEVPVRRAPRRHYKIQEVIKRRQILLVQVVKEERGTKGAALTTYLSLAGRYSVLMPNTARGGGISRKITNASDRKRLKSIASGLDVPTGMGVILRTAGASRNTQDIQRDFEYLMRLWENVRTLTLESTAPCLVYEEGSLIKRSIRDLYDADTGEILVAGETGYREAKDFMAMLMPNHAKNVKQYKDRIPLFTRMGVEAQLDAMLQTQVTLKSGGYLIIDQTEALVAIDVNSGRSTRQHSIEDTATQTNLEAADEVARQLRLRDLAGLIVIDFIDMEDKRNIRAVEKKLKDALKNDRARIQLGRISHFGLMEMSRQRIRASVLESTTQVCPTCEGLGHVRAASSVVLAVLRAIEEQLNRSSKHNLAVKVSTPTALYMLNNKRDNLGDLEQRFGVSISIETDDAMGGQPCIIDRGEVANSQTDNGNRVQPDSIALTDDPVEAADDQSRSDSGSNTDAVKDTENQSAATADDNGEEENQGKKRRRRRRKRKSAANSSDAIGDADQSVHNEQSSQGSTKKPSSGDTDPENATDPSSPIAAERGKEALSSMPGSEQHGASANTSQLIPAAPDSEESSAGEEQNRANSKTPRRNTKRKKDGTGAAPVDEVIANLALNGDDVRPQEQAEAAPAEIAEENSPEKGGWWQRKFF